jgi:hypothetical protein
MRDGRRVTCGIGRVDAYRGARGCGRAERARWPGNVCRPIARECQSSLRQPANYGTAGKVAHGAVEQGVEADER